MVLLEKSSGIQDPNAGSKYGRRPLHLAAVLGDPKPLMRLLAFRADPAAVDEARISPFRLAIDKDIRVNERASGRLIGWAELGTRFKSSGGVGSMGHRRNC